MTMTYQIVPADLQEQQVACMHGRIPQAGIPTFLATAFSTVHRAIAQQGLLPGGRPFARYRFQDDGLVDVEAGFPISGTMSRTGDVEPGTLAGGHVVTTVHTGSYDAVGNAYQALEIYLSRNGYEPAGAAWESYLDDPDVPEPRTKVYLPAEKLSRREH